MSPLKAILACTVAVAAVSTQAFPIAAPGTEGLLVIVTNGEDVVATYEGNSASYSNDLYLENTGQFVFNNQTSPVGSSVNLGTFAVGTELVFRLHVNNTGYDFFTGPASRNPDGQPHARVESDFMQAGKTLVSFEDLFNGPFVYNDLSFSFTNTKGVLPEPETYLLMLGGIALVWHAARRRRL